MDPSTRSVAGRVLGVGARRRTRIGILLALAVFWVSSLKLCVWEHELVAYEPASTRTYARGVTIYPFLRAERSERKPSRHFSTRIAEQGPFSFLVTVRDPSLTALRARLSSLRIAKIGGGWVVPMDPTGTAWSSFVPSRWTKDYREVILLARPTRERDGGLLLSDEAIMADISVELEYDGKVVERVDDHIELKRTSKSRFGCLPFDWMAGT